MTRKITLFIAALFLCGAMQAQSYHWSYNYHDYENNFPFIGEVYLNGEVVASSDFEIAAFVGDQVRATEFLFEADPDNYPGLYYAWLGVAYNNTGETVTFKLYDHATNTEYDNCSTTVLTNADGYGETWDPVVVEFTTPISYGPEYPWVVSGGFENYMYLETQIQIDGVPVTNTNWEVGAFSGDECRGLGDADNWWVSPVDNSNILEIVVGGATGDVINFYLYDVTNQEVFPGVCIVSLDWVDGDIGDMYEPFVLNYVPAQTFTKQITGYTSGLNDHYYLLASPIGEVSPTDVDKMLRNDFDLYYFDQAQNLEWINYEGGDGNFNLEAGKGYLYANSADVTLTFTGVPYQGDGKVTLNKTEDAIWEGWNLVGNPFAETAYIEKDFYRMNAEGTNLIAPDPNDQAIAAMEGIFVVADNDGEILTFSTQALSAKSAALVMNITRNNRGAAVDRAIIRFDNENTLPKFTLNERSTKLYIPQDNKDYAVVSANNDGEMPLYFKAAENGTYNLDFSKESVDFSYLHLIDNITGTDIDLLINPSYSFDARTTDYASRFRLVFSTQSNNNDHFAFISNGQIILNGVDANATIQVIDALGRVVVSRTVGGQSISTKGMTAGVYVLRLIEGNETRTQKILVK